MSHSFDDCWGKFNPEAAKNKITFKGFRYCGIKRNTGLAKISEKGSL